MMQILAWAGARGRWVLALGVVAALLIPEPGDLLAGTLPFWVALLVGLAMMRIDLVAVARGAVAPRRLIPNLAMAAGLLCVTPALFWWVATMLGLPQGHVAALVYTSAAPPLGSGAAFCLLIGFNAAFAIEMTVLCSALAPLTLPLMAQLLMGGDAPVDTAEMATRLVILIGAAGAGALLARRILGARWVEKRGQSLDGLSAIILVIFLFPLFDGLLAEIIAEPAFAFGVLALAVAANLGTQIALFPVTRRIAGFATGGAAALIWGNRNAALALASLPPDPVMTLYVALYQFPMYFTPLVMARIAKAPLER
ncbi:MAG: hypothetical protein AAGH68_00220 [Pseudomonadota bacterium]